MGVNQKNRMSDNFQEKEKEGKKDEKVMIEPVDINKISKEGGEYFTEKENEPKVGDKIKIKPDIIKENPNKLFTQDDESPQRNLIEKEKVSDYFPENEKE